MQITMYFKSQIKKRMLFWNPAAAGLYYIVRRKEEKTAVLFTKKIRSALHYNSAHKEGGIAPFFRMEDFWRQVKLLTVFLNVSYFFFHFSCYHLGKYFLWEAVG